MRLIVGVVVVAALAAFLLWLTVAGPGQPGPRAGATDAPAAPRSAPLMAHAAGGAGAIAAARPIDVRGAELDGDARWLAISTTIGSMGRRSRIDSVPYRISDMSCQATQLPVSWRTIRLAR